MQGSNKNGVLHGRVAETVRKAGSSFLDSTCGALESLLSMDEFGGVDESRVFAYDGLDAAVLVVEDQTRIFCAKVATGLYDLG